MAKDSNPFIEAGASLVSDESLLTGSARNPFLEAGAKEYTGHLPPALIRSEINPMDAIVENRDSAFFNLQASSPSMGRGAEPLSVLKTIREADPQTLKQMAEEKKNDHSLYQYLVAGGEGVIKGTNSILSAAARYGTSENAGKLVAAGAVNPAFMPVEAIRQMTTGGGFQDGAADEINRSAAQLDKVQSQEFGPSVARGITSSTLTMVPAAAVGGPVAGPLLAAGAAGLTGANESHTQALDDYRAKAKQKYQASIERGASQEEARAQLDSDMKDAEVYASRYAIAKGGAEAAVTIVMNKLVGAGLEGVAAEGLKTGGRAGAIEAVKSLVKSTVKEELPEEYVVGLANKVVDKIGGQTDVTWTEIGIAATGAPIVTAPVKALFGAKLSETERDTLQIMAQTAGQGSLVGTPGVARAAVADAEAAVEAENARKGMVPPASPAEDRAFQDRMNQLEMEYQASQFKGPGDPEPLPDEKPAYAVEEAVPRGASQERAGQGERVPVAGPVAAEGEKRATVQGPTIQPPPKKSILKKKSIEQAVPQEQSSTELSDTVSPSEIVPPQKARSPLTDMITKAMTRDAMEAEGQSILDDMEESGESPAEVSKKFWSDTYFNLPVESQRKMQRYLKNLTGWEPGSTIAVNVDGSSVAAEDWIQIGSEFGGDLPSDASYLEGTERGYVAMMKWANANQAAPESPVTQEGDPPALPAPFSDSVSLDSQQDAQSAEPVQDSEQPAVDNAFGGIEARYKEAIDNLKKKTGKRKFSQSEIDAEVKSILADRSSAASIRTEFSESITAEKKYEADKKGRQEFVGRHRAKAAANSILVGDTSQVAQDVEAGRLTADEAIAMAKDAVASGFTPELKLKQLEGYLAELPPPKKSILKRITRTPSGQGVFDGMEGEAFDAEERDRIQADFDRNYRGKLESLGYSPERAAQHKDALYSIPWIVSQRVKESNEDNIEDVMLSVAEEVKKTLPQGEESDEDGDGRDEMINDLVYEELKKQGGNGPAPQQEKVKTIAGEMTLDEFESKGYSPEQVTKEDWVNLQRANRRALGQPEESGPKASPFADYEEFHKDAVKRAIKAGEEVDEEVLKDYPELAEKPSASSYLRTEEIKALPEYSVYKINTNSGDRWAVRGKTESGYGDSVHKSEQEATSYAELTRKNAVDNEAFRNAAKAKAEKEEADRAEREKNLDAFVSSMTPMAAGKARKVLDAQKGYRSSETGKTYTGKRWEVMQEMVKDGFAPSTFDGKPTLKFGADGAFFDITKAEHEFASFLIEQKPSAEPVAEEQMKEQPVATEEANPVSAELPISASPRTSPTLGTDERTKLDEEASSAWEAYQKLSDELASLETEVDRSKGLVKKKALIKKRDKAREASGAAWDKWGAVRDKARVAKLDDAATSDDPLIAAVARLALLREQGKVDSKTSDKVAEFVQTKLEETSVKAAQEADGAGVLPAKDDKNAIRIAVGEMTNSLINSPMKAVDGKVEKELAGMIRGERLRLARANAEKEIEGIDGIGGGDKREALSTIGTAYDFDRLTKIVEKAKQDAKQSREFKKREEELAEEMSKAAKFSAAPYSGEIVYAEQKNKEAGVKKIVRATGGDGALHLKQDNYSDLWSIVEATAGKESKKAIADGIDGLRKAKEVAQRIFAGTFDPEADLKFTKEAGPSLHLTNDSLAKEIEAIGVKRDSIVRLLRENGIWTDGRALILLRDKDRDSVLSKVGKTDEGRDMGGVVKEMLTDGAKAFRYRDQAMAPVAYRGGDITDRDVVLKSEEGKFESVDKKLHDTIMTRHPGATPYWSGDEKAIAYEKDGEAVALLMPKKFKDKNFKDLVAGKYQFKEAPPQEAPQKKSVLKKKATAPPPPDQPGSTAFPAGTPLNEHGLPSTPYWFDAERVRELGFAGLLEGRLRQEGAWYSLKGREIVRDAFNEVIESATEDQLKQFISSRRDEASRMGFRDDSDMFSYSDMKNRAEQTLKARQGGPAKKKAVEAAREQADQAEASAPTDQSFGLFGGGSSRVRTDSVPTEIQADDPELEANLQISHGNDQNRETFLDRVVEFFRTAGKAMTRSNIFIPNDTAHASQNEMLRIRKTIPTIAEDEANRTMGSILDPLGPNQFKLFERKVIIDNLAASLQRGELERFGKTATLENVLKYQKKLDALVARSPEVQKAIATRKAVVADLVDQLIENKLLKEDAREKADTYYHQQVLAYQEVGGRSSNPQLVKRGFQKRRAVQSGEMEDKTAYNYNTSYIEAEKEWLRDAFSQLEKTKWLDKVEKMFGKTAEAKAAGKATGKPWKSLVKEADGWKVWQAKPGNAHYKALGVAEKAVEGILEGFEDTAEISREDLREVLVLSAPQREMVLPAEFADQLDLMTESVSHGPFKNGITALSKEAINTWKIWTLLNPLKAVGYTARNTMGDLDALIGGGAMWAMKYAPEASTELASYYGVFGAGQKISLSPVMKLARDLGVIDASMSQSDMPDMKDMAILKRFYTSDKAGLADMVRKYFDTVKKYSAFRESIARLAAFKYYRKALQDGDLSHYGGASKAIIDKLVADMGVDVAAAHLSRNLMGDYGDMTVLGDFMRNHTHPFWSWIEVNLKRYPQFIMNAALSGPRSGKDPITAAALSTGAVAAIGLPLAIMSLFNNMFWGDEEDKLSGDERSSPHLILGRNPDGSLIILRNVSALGDFMEWFGLNTMLSRLDELDANQMTYTELAQEMMKDTANKFLGGIRPEIKGFYEMGTGYSTYPDAFNPIPKPRDEMLASYAGLQDVYREAKGRISQDGTRARPNFAARMLGVSDPKKNALYEILELRDRFSEKKQEGKFPKNVPFSNMRDAAGTDDWTAFQEARNAYLEKGGNFEKFMASAERLDPLSGLPEKDHEEFKSFLSFDQQEKLGRAREYGQEMRVKMWQMWNHFSEQDPPEIKAEMNRQRMDMALRRARTMIESKPLSVTPKEKENGLTIQEKQAKWEEDRKNAKREILASGLDRKEVMEGFRAMIRSEMKDVDGMLEKASRLRRAMGWQ